jgi:hypothetical protein
MIFRGPLKVIRFGDVEKNKDGYINYVQPEHRKDVVHVQNEKPALVDGDLPVRTFPINR